MTRTSPSRLITSRLRVSVVRSTPMRAASSLIVRSIPALPSDSEITASVLNWVFVNPLGRSARS
ncbi:Uncharacterised protein [Mycobacterium tuberculosis]|nr:Uncharacterised protein [Mycobacterium tuberculosis]